MAQVAVRFQDEELTLDVPEGRLIAAWRGPAPLPQGALAAALAASLEAPADYPPLKRAVVPGDRVAVVLGPRLPEPAAIVLAVCDVLIRAGVEAADVTILAADEGDGLDPAGLPRGVAVRRHDPSDRSQLAYLATTDGGRRIYLNRLLTDADFVLPIGTLWRDPIAGLQGPWSAVFPGMSDEDSRRPPSATRTAARPGPDAEARAAREAAEVCWLLGAQFQVGVIPGVDGVARVLAGLGEAVRREAASALGQTWELRAEERAELVILGVGRPGQPSDFEDVARGLATATRLVRRGGKIVVLSRAGGDLGRATGALRGLDSPRDATAALRGLESAPDYPWARQLADSLAWADLYLASDLDPMLVEDLSILPLDRPSEAGRLARLCGSCTVVSQGDRTHASVTGEDSP